MIYLNLKYSLIVHGVCSLVLCSLFLIVTKVLSKNVPSIHKRSTYECGFKTFELYYYPFDIHFYKIGLLFLLLDVEILFLLPWVLNFHNISNIGHSSIIIFLGSLLVGLVYEFYNNLIKWY